MKFVTFSHRDRTAPGLWLDGDRVLDLPAAARLSRAPLEAKSLIEIVADPAALPVVRKLADRALDPALAPALLAAKEVRLLAPIPRPLKNVFCVGRNYLDHVREGYRAQAIDLKIPQHPQFFTKPPTTIIGPADDFRLDAALTQKLDYEVELALIIGKAGRDIPADRAFDHIFGYTVLNDITARDLQRRHDQWFKGKALDGSCPMGPWIVERSAIPDPRRLALSLLVNGEERQHATVDQMIFDIPTIIATLSAGLTLEPGDIIATGTPSGVGYAMEPPRFLAPGDIVTTRIEGIGQLVTRIVAA